VNTAWERWRYRRLLPVAGRAVRFGRPYAALVARVEWRRDETRRTVACARIERWMGCGPTDARRVYLRSLASEAREESDAAFFMGRPHALDGLFRTASGLATAGDAALYVGLHLGSPVLGYLHLCRSVAPELALIARGIDPANPMTADKRRFAAAKVRWTEAQAGRPFFATDGAAMLGVRRHLRGGKPLYMLADVPGDGVGRSAACTLLGERVRLAAGLPTLVRIADSAVQTLAVIRTDDGFTIWPGARIPADAVDLQAVLDALTPFIRAHPEQWWMWPYLPAAD
jgi:hypothetical protein